MMGLAVPARNIVKKHRSDMLPSIAALFAKLTELGHLLMLQLQLWFDAMRAWIGAHYL